MHLRVEKNNSNKLLIRIQLSMMLWKWRYSSSLIPISRIVLLFILYENITHFHQLTGITSAPHAQSFLRSPLWLVRRCHEVPRQCYDTNKRYHDNATTLIRRRHEVLRQCYDTNKRYRDNATTLIRRRHEVLRQCYDTNTRYHDNATTLIRRRHEVLRYKYEIPRQCYGIN
jgi:hypothetical protein